MAEWSKALVLGTSHFDGVGSNPTAATFFFFFSSLILFFCTFHDLEAICSFSYVDRFKKGVHIFFGKVLFVYRRFCPMLICVEEGSFYS